LAFFRDFFEMRRVRSWTEHAPLAFLVPNCSLAHRNGRALFIFSKTPTHWAAAWLQRYPPLDFRPFFDCFSQMRQVSSWTEHFLWAILVPNCSLSHGVGQALIIFQKCLTTWCPGAGLGDLPPRTFQEFFDFSRNLTNSWIFWTNRFVSKPW
jgi:hypothetical protein